MKKSRLDKMDSDYFLLEKLKSGNISAFDSLFNKYYKNLCRFAFLLIHDADLSQSLVQNVFIKLWEKRFVLATINNVQGYLITMVRNQCFDYLKEKKVQKDALKKISKSELDNSTQDYIYCNDFEEKLIAVLFKLPPRCRMAFEYSRFKNMSNKEIASKMDITLKGVEALIARALKILRAELEDFLPSANSKNNQHILFFLEFSKNNS